MKNQKIASILIKYYLVFLDRQKIFNYEHRKIIY